VKSILEDTTPKAKKSLRSSQAIRDQITPVPSYLRRARVVLLGARKDAQQAASVIANGLIYNDSGDLDEPASGAYLDLGKNLTEAASLAFFVQALEADETVQEAMALLEPLYQEHAEAIERERIAAAQERAARQEREDRKAAALAKAAAEIEAQFATV
jgi:hypothetical protein